MSEARLALKAAQFGVVKQKENVRALAGVLERSQQMVAEDTASLKAFESLNADIVSVRISAAKSGMDPRILPAELKERMAARNAAQDELEQAEGAVKVLEGELQAAEALLKQLEGEREQRAFDVLLDHADGLAKRLIEINEEQFSLNVILEGVNRLAGGYGRSTRAIQTALQQYSPGYYGPNADPIGIMATRWAERINALVADADASVDGLKPVYPSDCN